jgi:isopentenyldiphosphate isomerase
VAAQELLRIYTPGGEPTDTFKPRAEVHRDGDWHATVHLWVLNSSGELLFQKRSDDAELHPGLWDVSAAGHVVGDDSLEVSLERESLEELGVTVSAKDAEWLFTLQTQLHTETLHERVFQHIYLMHKDIALSELHLQQDEVTAVAWHHHALLERLVQDPAGYVPRTEEYDRLSAYLRASP